MNIRTQRVTSVARWDRPRAFRLWWEQDYELHLSMVCVSIIVAGWSYELWVRL